MKEYVQIEKQEYINLLVTIENLKHSLDQMLEDYNQVMKSINDWVENNE